MQAGDRHRPKLGYRHNGEQPVSITSSRQLRLRVTHAVQTSNSRTVLAQQRKTKEHEYLGPRTWLLSMSSYVHPGSRRGTGLGGVAEGGPSSGLVVVPMSLYI
ncbi:hypothetical protein PISMIDRAFT_12196 [Pisolithus microcarpus 441]|uniref:Uncharacterized protein n=1 Tax=Pisolithus microcarpus 441 TaxID=765257 RepID=A0A0C9ZGG0_9AGAM|nr:hypothetical protein PISMIDRAFT_12196 [Pisolithus microcarpus 441]